MSVSFFTLNFFSLARFARNVVKSLKANILNYSQTFEFSREKSLFSPADFNEDFWRVNSNIFKKLNINVARFARSVVKSLKGDFLSDIFKH